MAVVKDKSQCELEKFYNLIYSDGHKLQGVDAGTINID